MDSRVRQEDLHVDLASLKLDLDLLGKLCIGPSREAIVVTRLEVDIADGGINCIGKIANLGP